MGSAYILLGRWIDAYDHMYVDNLAVDEKQCPPFCQRFWGAYPFLSSAFFCRIFDQVDWNHFYLSFFCYRIFCNSALAPNFSINPLFGKADMGSLVHSRECGEPTAVSVTSFHPDLVAEIVKCGSRRLNLRFLALAKYLVYFYCCRTRTRTYHLKKK